MPKNTAIELLKDLVTTDMKAGNTTEFYVEIPGHPDFGFVVNLDNLLTLLSDPADKIHKAVEVVGIVGSNQLPSKKKDPGTLETCFSIPLYNMDQLSDMLRKQDTRPA
jgi:hypothetical protein